MRCFFFGTLQDPDLRALVIGRPAEAEPAWLSGYRRCRARGESYPVLVPAAGEVDGVVVRGISPDEAARIAWFEDEDYVPCTRAVRLGNGRQRDAAVWMPTGRLAAEPQPWRLRDWQRAEKATLIALAERWMALQGRIGPGETAAAWQTLKAEMADRSGGRRAAG